MRRAVAIGFVGLAALGCLSSATRTPESCVKDAILASQRATARIAGALEYAEGLAAIESLQAESAEVGRLLEELNSLPQPSSWERSRMRRHRPLAKSAQETWDAEQASLRQRLEAGQFPPDLRQKLEEAMAAFDGKHKQFWSVVRLEEN